MYIFSARQCVERSFGIMAKRFDRFRRPLEVCPDVATSIIYSATVLHNFLIDNGEEIIVNFDDSQGPILSEDFVNPSLPATKNSTEAQVTRLKFVNLFASE